METVATLLDGRIDLSPPNVRYLRFALITIVLSPTFWNLAARLEYQTRFLTKLFGGRNRIAAYFLAVNIFTISSFRTYYFEKAVSSQPQFPVKNEQVVNAMAIFLGTIGSILVVTSYYRLGVVGTYLGDYFGILMKERVTGFPFNLMENPMYNGSTLIYLASSLWWRSYAGLLLTFFVYVIYFIFAHYFEEPFTAYIYSEAARNKKGHAKRQNGKVANGKLE